jgi:hypothetical protein
MKFEAPPKKLACHAELKGWLLDWTGKEQKRLRGDFLHSDLQSFGTLGMMLGSLVQSKIRLKLWGEQWRE